VWARLPTFIADIAVKFRALLSMARMYINATAMVLAVILGIATVARQDNCQKTLPSVALRILEGKLSIRNP